MSVTVPKEAIEVIAQSIGIHNLSPDVFPSLAADVEYRLREIMQESIKCMHHSKRTTLTSVDVDDALQLRDIEPIYGFGSGDSLKFKRAARQKDFFYINDKDVEFKDVIEAPLPKAPQETAVVAHWLAIEGVQPAIPENATLEALAMPSDNKRSDYKEDGISVDIKYPVKHVLSRELQLYFEKITELTVGRSDSILFRKALLSLATDSGLHPLVPYFTYFIADEVMRNLKIFPILFSLMRLVRSLLQNPHLHVEPYLHQLMPSIMTCLVAKRLGNKISDNHWELRNFTSNLIALICKRYGHAYHTLQSRVTKTLLHTFLDPIKTLPQHYGAIQGLAALGPNVVRTVILPNLETYLQLIEPEMHPEKQKNDVTRDEAWRVYGALLCAAGQCINKTFKLLPAFLSPPTRVPWKINRKVLTTMANKRKASVDNMMHQPPLRRVATEGSLGAIPVNSLPIDIQRATRGYQPTTLGGSNVGIQSMPRQLPNESVTREAQVKQKPAASTRVRKEVTDTGKLLPLLTESFGESTLSFIPTPLLTIFL